MAGKKSDQTWTSGASKWATQGGVHAASVDRIINQVEKSRDGKKCIEQVGRDQLTGRLAEQLMGIWAKWIWYSSVDSEHRPAASRMRAQLFREIATNATIFKEQLLKGESVKHALESAVVQQIASRFPTISDFSAFLAGLDHTIRAAEDLTQLYEGEWVQFDRPPKEWLVAETLPPIFKDCFGRKAGISETGPYIIFAAAVMREMGLEYSSASIRRALTRRSRRNKEPKRSLG